MQATDSPARRQRRANIVIAGVGGQGSIVASHLLAEAALRDGLETKLAETFGAATRGGSVMAHVRIGDVWAPMIMPDEAHVVISMEPLEALRVSLTFLKPGGWVLFNTHPWIPIDVAVGRAEYPGQEHIVAALARLGAQVLTLDATMLAQEAGNARCANTVMLGGLMGVGLLEVSEASLFAAMEARWPDKLVEVNRRAYDLGYQAVRRATGAAA